MRNELAEVGVVFNPVYLARQIHEPHCRPRNRARIGRSTDRLLSHVEYVGHGQGFAFGRATSAQIDAVLRERLMNSLTTTLACSKDGLDNQPPPTRIYFAERSIPARSSGARFGSFPL